MTVSEEIIIQMETTISFLISHGHVDGFGRDALKEMQERIVRLKDELRKNGKI